MNNFKKEEVVKAALEKEKQARRGLNKVEDIIEEAKSQTNKNRNILATSTKQYEMEVAKLSTELQNAT